MAFSVYYIRLNQLSSVVKNRRSQLVIRRPISFYASFAASIRYGFFVTISHSTIHYNKQSYSTGGSLAWVPLACAASERRRESNWPHKAILWTFASSDGWFVV